MIGYELYGGPLDGQKLHFRKPPPRLEWVLDTKALPHRRFAEYVFSSERNGFQWVKSHDKSQGVVHQEEAAPVRWAALDGRTMYVWTNVDTLGDL